jgi:predicted enzyme related to lactoylglutathione lyase
MNKTKTYGLTHIAVSVKDLVRTKAFYQTVFDMEIMYDEPDFIQLTTPGTHDILVFEKKRNVTGNSGGIAHFGFRLREPGDIRDLQRKIKKAGGVITGQGEFLPGSPYFFFKDPDGYAVEVWYELLSS